MGPGGLSAGFGEGYACTSILGTFKHMTITKTHMYGDGNIPRQKGEAAVNPDGMGGLELYKTGCILFLHQGVY